MKKANALALFVTSILCSQVLAAPLLAEWTGKYPSDKINEVLRTFRRGHLQE